MISEHGTLPAVLWPAPRRVRWQVLSQRLGRNRGVFWVWKVPDRLRSAVTMKKPGQPRVLPRCLWHRSYPSQNAL